MFIVQATIKGSVVKFNCETITEVRSKLDFIELDKKKYGRKWTKIKVIAKDEDVTKLFL